MADQNDQGGAGQVFHRGVGDILQRDGQGPLDANAPMAKLFGERVGIDTSDIYIFPLAPSTQAVDSYYTRMSEQALRTYKENAISGVPFMNSHRTGGCLQNSELPLGYSFEAELTGAGVDESPVLSRSEIPDPENQDLADRGIVLRTWDYMQRDLRLNGDGAPGTDDVIKGIKSKTVRQVSIGFGSDNPRQLLYRCGLCGNQMGKRNEDQDMDCQHAPGARDKETGHVAFAWVEQSRMFETSAVWAGATPGAVVENAPADLVMQVRTVAASGLMTMEEIDFAEHMYRTRVRPGQSFPASGTRAPSEVNAMAEEKDVKTSGEEEQIDGEPCSKTEVRTVKDHLVGIEGALDKFTNSTAELMTSLVESNAQLAEALTERASEVTVTLDEGDLDEQLNARFDDLQAEIDSLKGEQDADAVTARDLLVERVTKATIRAEGQGANIETLEKMLAVLDEEELLAEAKRIEASNPFKAGRKIISPDLPGNGKQREVDVSLYQ